VEFLSCSAPALDFALARARPKEFGFFLTYIPFFLCGSRFFYSKDHFKKLNYPGDFKDLAKPSV
jgi:hypothetical protein